MKEISLRQIESNCTALNAKAKHFAGQKVVGIAGKSRRLLVTGMAAGQRSARRKSHPDHALVFLRFSGALSSAIQPAILPAAPGSDASSVRQEGPQTD